MSAAKSRASGLSVGKNSTMQSQSFSSCQYGEIVFVLHPQDPHIPFSGVLVQNSRYTDDTQSVGSFVFPYRYLQGITVRPVPCDYNLIQSVSALSPR
jgi:hypothetical protein